MSWLQRRFSKTAVEVNAWMNNYIPSKTIIVIFYPPSSWHNERLLKDKQWRVAIFLFYRFIICAYFNSRFIMSSRCLCIETRRWWSPVSIPYERRYCAWCRYKIEDEYDMLSKCELYDELRNTLEPRYFRVRSSMFKLIEVINSANDKQIHGLAKFVYNAFKIRSDLGTVSILGRRLSSIGIPIVKMRPSYLYNGNPNTGKTAPLYLNGAWHEQHANHSVRAFHCELFMLLSSGRGLHLFNVRTLNKDGTLIKCRRTLI